MNSSHWDIESPLSNTDQTLSTGAVWSHVWRSSLNAGASPCRLWDGSREPPSPKKSWVYLTEGGSDTRRAALRFLTAFPAARLSDDECIGSLMSPQIGWSGKPDLDLRRWAVTFIETYPDRLSALSELQVPCLVMGFEQDTDAYAARAREVAEALPHGHHLGLPTMGHAAPMSDPEAVGPPVIDFMSRHHPPH